MAERGENPSSSDPRLAPFYRAMNEGRHAFAGMMSTLDSCVADAMAVVLRQEEEIASCAQKHSMELASLRASRDALERERDDARSELERVWRAGEDKASKLGRLLETEQKLRLDSGAEASRLGAELEELRTAVQGMQAKHAEEAQTLAAERDRVKRAGEERCAALNDLLLTERSLRASDGHEASRLLREAEELREAVKVVEDSYSQLWAEKEKLAEENESLRTECKVWKKTAGTIKKESNKLGACPLPACPPCAARVLLLAPGALLPT